MQTTLDDLPDLALDLILAKLSPADLSAVSCTSRALRDMGDSDYLWARHLSEKWGSVIGRAACREWDWFYPLPAAGSMKALFLDLECGKLWFSAQVYNFQIEPDEDVIVGCMLTSYNAELTYDRHTDSFIARYPRCCDSEYIEEGVLWERLRLPPVDTPSHSLYDSECLNELRPGDHIEIQWKSNKESPYGWWYGVVGHLDPCDGNVDRCYCHKKDVVLIQFDQLVVNHKWGIHLNRNYHWEAEIETSVIFGGIRKLHQKDEISTWKQARDNSLRWEDSRRLRSAEFFR